MLVVLGNVACFACPLIAPRSVLRRWISPRWRWPKRLRSKWLAVGLVVIWLVAYEAFDLWASPVATAVLLVGLVAVATVVDLVFEGASFCRYVCPVGQYQMAVSTISPRTVVAMDVDRCATCATKDCLTGGPGGPGGGRIYPPCGAVREGTDFPPPYGGPPFVAVLGIVKDAAE